MDKNTGLIPPTPTLRELGLDLLRINSFQRMTCLFMPFACVFVYAIFASHRLWPLAILTLMYLSFVTYGSISHDLVHRTLGLPRPVNEFFLTFIELLAFRSGHAYRLVPLHHHPPFPPYHHIQGAAGPIAFFRTHLPSMIFPPPTMPCA